MEKLGSALEAAKDGVQGTSDKLGTEIDQRDMERIGKSQELRRNFRLIPILGFTAVLMCTWEAVLLWVE